MKRGSLIIFASVLAGCLPSGGDPTNPVNPSNPNNPNAKVTLEDQVLAGLPTGADQLKILCARGHRDAVAMGLCASPTIKSLGDLQRAVGLFAGDQVPQFAFTGHSTSLVGRHVSAINPRAIIFTAPSQGPNNNQNDGSNISDPGFVTMGFVRGEQLVELAAHDASQNQLHFYVVRFRQACNETVAGCSFGDLLTPDVESNWTSWSVYEDSELANTIFDCTHCHQPGGPTTQKMLRLQERRAPWTHWFRNNANQPGGVALLDDFQAAHGQSEDYAGIPAGLLASPRNDPLILEALIDNNSVSPQPNEFRTAKIEGEVNQSAPRQPEDNTPMGTSTTWDALYQNFLAGNTIQVPYHDVKVTDPNKLANMTAAYRLIMSGGAPKSTLPDIRDVLLDSGLIDMGYRPAAGLDGRGIMAQMCQRCHNSSVDPSLGRARFDVTKLSTMSRAEKDLAISRLSMGADVRTMPPQRFGELNAAEIAAVTAELQK